MNKSAPSPLRIGAMVVFALSCFGLLLFLWLSFGGPIPLKPKGYRVQAAFQEAPTLGLEADVRVAGVTVGKVRKKQLDPNGNRTLVTMELDRRFAPLSSDANAILRQKTLLGETYVELTPGSGGKPIPEGGRLADARIAPTVELDEIFDAFDEETRASFRSWQRDFGKGLEGHGRDFNDAIGTLPGFASDFSDVLGVLDSQEGAVRRLVKNTGVVFGALNEDERQLRNLITSSGRLFAATAAVDAELAETIRIFPTFLDESKATMARLKTFSRDTDPLVRDLTPVARDLAPTVRDVRALAPDLDRTFRDLDPLIKASKTGLPALRDTLRGMKPMLAELGPFLGQLNPILQYFEQNQMQISDFISNGGAATADRTVCREGTCHYLRQIGPKGSENVAIYGDRLETNRGNSYFNPRELYPEPPATDYYIFPTVDCRNAGGEKKGDDPEDGSTLGCLNKQPFKFQDRMQGTFPHTEANDYSK